MDWNPNIRIEGLHREARLLNPSRGLHQRHTIRSIPNRWAGPEIVWRDGTTRFLLAIGNTSGVEARRIPVERGNKTRRISRHRLVPAGCRFPRDRLWLGG